MMKNGAQVDRVVRIIVGIVLIFAYLNITTSWSWLLLVLGIVMLVTAALGRCWLYGPLGISTCKRG